MGYNQQDAQEFLRYLLEGLHEDVNRIAVKPRPLEHDISDDLRYLTCYVVHSRYFPLLSTCQLVFRVRILFRSFVILFVLLSTVIRRRPWNPGSVTWGETTRRSWTCLLASSNQLYSALSAVTAAWRLIPFGISLCLSRRPANPTSSCSTA